MKIFREISRYTVGLHRLEIERRCPLKLIQNLRNEAHRFGISFHRRLRHKSTLSSELDNVPGIGPSRKKILLKSLGSLARIKKASRAELAAVPGIGTELAGQIWNFFHIKQKG